MNGIVPLNVRVATIKLAWRQIGYREETQPKQNGVQRKIELMPNIEEIKIERSITWLLPIEPLL